VQTHRPSSTAYRIAIADNHNLMRVGVRTILQTQQEFEVCAEVQNGIDAIDCVNREAPDLLVLESTIPKTNGFEVARIVQRKSPTTAVLILSMNFSLAVASLLFGYGIRGYVLKTDVDAELLKAIHCIKQGKLFCSHGLAEAIVNRFIQEARRSRKRASPGQPRLTPREVEIVELLGKGAQNKEVAATLGVSVRTAESHRSHIMQKMQFTNLSDVVRYAIRAGIIEG
jgi:DNA-binding NarL/FixJ family response regulator